MPEYSVEAVFERLGPFHDDLSACVVDGWAKYVSEIQPTLPRWRRRAKRNAVNEAIFNELTTHFGDRPEWRLVETRQGHTLLVLDANGGVGPIVIRAKFVGENLRTRNFRTPTSDNFDAQRPIRVVPPGIRLALGYILNVDETELSGIEMLYAVRREVIWHYPVAFPGADRITELPQRHLELPSEERVQPKRQGDDRSEEGGEE